MRHDFQSDQHSKPEAVPVAAPKRVLHPEMLAIAGIVAVLWAIVAIRFCLEFMAS
ncbi:hypothetical protein [Novosphingobium sp. Rr 2-17]|uniref:hypothetical protein n=1 Tax=Novosphingobium sp. Rr 2-17 TaxID=555793 RepID=UPI0012F6D3DF|nr:hypothetical protein [Novosphingobium sp. Rr 2-17]